MAIMLPNDSWLLLPWTFAAGVGDTAAHEIRRCEPVASQVNSATAAVRADSSRAPSLRNVRTAAATNFPASGSILRVGRPKIGYVTSDSEG